MILHKILNRLIFNPEYIPSRFSLIFAIVGCTGIILLDRIINLDLVEIPPFEVGIGYTLVMALILYFLLRHMLSLIKETEASYLAVEKREKESLRLFNFALDNSADATYWFTFDGHFYYVNDAASRMLGYSKEELLRMNLWEMDLNFSTLQAQKFLQKIKEVKHTTFETMQTRKDGKNLPIEVSANYFTHEGEEFICAFGRDISERRNYQNAIESANEELTKSIAEKETLLKEVHHRVKNNLEIISSLLSMQYRRVNDTNMRMILQQSRSRIHTMSLVHEFLYKSKTLDDINLNDYIQRLLTDIISLHAQDHANITLNIDIPPIHFSTDASIRLGMVLHELCVNSIKYAFKNRNNNVINITLKLKNEIIHVCVADNGVGIENVQSLLESNSLGIQLIKTITEEQLDGEVAFRLDHGLVCDIYFPRKAVQ
ncbi:sensor histidine kinase [Sulfurospirillum sp. 1612]|uniref:sensor histidine kinase n=1 Tax=Sulfurospirillum sp. 1612 TaxID=3094835 RepID=UPI002F934468